MTELEQKHTGVMCSCGRYYVEDDGSPWDKSEWLCNQCHADIEEMRRKGEWIWRDPGIYPNDR
jgi:hypothetical protein